MEDRLKRRENESFDDYRFRLYKNRIAYGLKMKDVYKLLMKVAPKQYGESTLRCTSMDMVKGYEKKEKELNQKFDKSIMIINDLHLPYEREDVLEVIQKHVNEIDTLVFGGDLIDCESVSSFSSIGKLSLEEELIYAYRFMKKVRKILSNNQKIIMICGNHEDRVKTYIAKMHEKDLQTFINPNILNMLTDGFTLYDKKGKKHKYDGIENITYIPHWYVNIDKKLIVCHPKDFSRVKGKMLENVSSHFINRHEEFEVISISHTHKYSSGIVDRYASVYAYENMCMCKPHEYSDTGKTGYAPQSYGYSIVKYNDNKPIKYENIKTYHLQETIDTNIKSLIEL